MSLQANSIDWWMPQDKNIIQINYHMLLIIFVKVNNELSSSVFNIIFNKNDYVRWARREHPRCVVLPLPRQKSLHKATSPVSTSPVLLSVSQTFNYIWCAAIKIQFSTLSAGPLLLLGYRDLALHEDYKHPTPSTSLHHLSPPLPSLKFFFLSTPFWLTYCALSPSIFTLLSTPPISCI